MPPIWMKERIAKSLFWLVWSRGLLQVVSFCSGLVVARLLKPDDYGLMALAGTWIAIASLIAELGLGAAIIQFPHLEDGEINACFWLTLATAWAAYGALFALAPGISAWFASARLCAVLRIAGLTLPLTAIRTVPEGLLRKRLELDKVSKTEVAALLGTIPVTLGLAFFGAGVWALVAGALTIPLIRGIASFWFVRWWPGLRLRGRRFQEIARYSLAVSGTNTLWAIYQQVDTLILGKMSGAAVVGFYFMARLLANLPLEKVSAPFNQIAYPVLAELQADRSAMRASFLRVLRLTACVTVPASVGLALIAEDLVAVALADKWAPVVPLLRVLSICGLIRCLGVLLPPVLFARYRTAFLFKWTASGLVLTTLAFWGGAAWSGALGVALASIIVYPLLTVWMAGATFREIEVGWYTIWDELRPVVRAALVMTGWILVLLEAMRVAEVGDPLARLAFTSGSGAVIYAATIIRCGGRLTTELAEVAGWVFLGTHSVPAAK
jgi:teichuronic acid exporter